MSEEDYQAGVAKLRADWGGLHVDRSSPGILRADNDAMTGILVGIRAPIIAEIINRALTSGEQ